MTTVLISLSASLSSVSSLCLFLLIGFSPHCGFLFLCMPGNFYWMADNVNFNLLCTGYYCVSINILEFCSRMQLN